MHKLNFGFKRPPINTRAPSTRIPCHSIPLAPFKSKAPTTVDVQHSKHSLRHFEGRRVHREQTTKLISFSSYFDFISATPIYRRSYLPVFYYRLKVALKRAISRAAAVFCISRGRFVDSAPGTPLILSNTSRLLFRLHISRRMCCSSLERTPRASAPQMYM